MTNQFESRINEIIAAAVAQIAGAVRADIGAQVRSALSAATGGKAISAPAKAPVKAAAKQVAAPAKAKGKAKAAPKAKAPAKKAKGSKFVRRTPAEIKADLDKLMSFIKGNPEKRSEEIQKGLGMARPNVASGLQTLRDAGRVKMKGIKRAATYSAA